LSAPRGLAGAALGSDGRIYFIGGFTGGPSSAVEAYGPRFTLTPSSGAAGTMVQVSGDNFAANALAALTWNGAMVPLATGATDGAGKIGAPITFAVPQAAAGAYTVTMYDTRSLYPVKRVFTVK
jgi:hypothetical protein